MILYYRPTCPFCIKVLNAAEQLGIELELRNIGESTEYYAELMEKGGKSQVPFLVDNDTSMYESDDIITYLNGH